MQFRGRRVTIMGLGHFGGGLSAARWLARQGATLTVTDLAGEDVLAPSLAALAGVPIARFHLGGHREADFRRTDLVVVNPAVRPDNPFLQVARDAGARLTSEAELFLEACRGHMIGVTGSNGKSTTAAMTAAMLRAHGRTTWLGGNIGGSLLERLDQIGPEDWVVMELSSFQLWHLGPSARMPEVAVLTNCSPNHLDWHPSYDHYRAAKQRILTGQKPGGVAVLNARDAEVATWSCLVRGRQLRLVPEADIPALAVPGEHNRANAACAATAALGVGCGWEAIQAALASFRALEQRLEMFAVVGGRRFYNDSASTTPGSTIAGLRALDGPVWLLAGGRDKGIDLGPLAASVVRHAAGAAFYGAVRDILRRKVADCAADFACTTVETIAAALEWCWQRSRLGHSIVLSPACASHDQFQNFKQRGAKFSELVQALADAHRS
jgi:UDP-N-acetylmuramoylalanine--D-glutamate ligase